MQQNPDGFVEVARLGILLGPVVIVVIALHVAYLRGNGVRTTGTAVSNRTEYRSHRDSDGRLRTDRFHFTTVDYRDRDGVAHTCEISGHYRKGSTVKLIYLPRKPHRAKPAYDASYGRVFVAIIAYAVFVAFVRHNGA